MAAGSKQSLDMTHGSIAVKLILFTIPLILGDLLQQCYNIADCVIVGQNVGKEAFAAVSATSNITMILVGFFTGLSIGATSVIARQFGAKDRLAFRRRSTRRS